MNDEGVLDFNSANVIIEAPVENGSIVISNTFLFYRYSFHEFNFYRFISLQRFGSRNIIRDLAIEGFFLRCNKVTYYLLFLPVSYSD